MRNKFKLESPRRDFLRLGIGVASGIVLSAGVGRCSKKYSEQTFVQPDVLVSQNGVLDVTLTVSYWNSQLSGED